MTAIFCFIDQRIASLLYFHYSRNLSLYKCCLAKFGCTTIIVIFQILFNRQCFLRKQPIVRSNVNDIEMSYPQTDEPTLNVSRHGNSQITQPSRFQKKNYSQQTSAGIANQTPSFNLRSNMKSTPSHRGTQSQVRLGSTTPTLHTRARNSNSDLDFDAIETHPQGFETEI